MTESEGFVKKLLGDIVQVKKAISEKNVKVKTLSYTLKISLLELKGHLYRKGSKEEKDLVNSEDYHSVLSYLEKEILPLSDPLSAEDIELCFPVFEEEFLPLLDILQENLEKLLIKEGSEINVVYSKKYLNRCKKNVYKENEKVIQRVVNKIIEYFGRGKSPGGSEIAKRKTDGGDELHANIPSPLADHRIVYVFDKDSRTITFLNIGTHKELGFGGSGS